MRITMVARRRDQAGRRTLCIVRFLNGYGVAVMPRPGQLFPLDQGHYALYEQAWGRLNRACGVEEETRDGSLHQI